MCGCVCTQPRRSSINSLVAILSHPILCWPQASRTQWKPWEMNRDTGREWKQEQGRQREISPAAAAQWLLWEMKREILMSHKMSLWDWPTLFDSYWSQAYTAAQQHTVHHMRMVLWEQFVLNAAHQILHTRTHARTHARTHTHIHTHTHNLLNNYIISAQVTWGYMRAEMTNQTGVMLCAEVYWGGWWVTRLKTGQQIFPEHL